MTDFFEGNTYVDCLFRIDQIFEISQVFKNTINFLYIKIYCAGRNFVQF